MLIYYNVKEPGHEEGDYVPEGAHVIDGSIDSGKVIGSLQGRGDSLG